MCLIIASESGIKPDAVVMHQAYTDNPHGIGIMWCEDNHVKVWKGWKVQKAIKQLGKIPDGAPLVIHFRWATHGTVDTANCHPFEVQKDLYLAHNGVIHDVPLTNPKRSDTWHFAQMLREAGLTADEVREQGNVKAIGDMVGAGNKLAFLDSQGRVTIVNRGCGVEWQGMWFSNSYSLPDRYHDEIRQQWAIEAGRGAGAGYRGAGRGNADTPPWWLDQSEQAGDEEFPYSGYCDYCDTYSEHLVYSREYTADVCADCEDWIKREQEAIDLYDLEAIDLEAIEQEQE